MASAATIIGDPAWMPHRLDMAGRRIQFLKIDRERLGEGPFLAQFEPYGEQDQTWLTLADLQHVAQPGGRLHFIFHTAFCRSTLLAKALDIPEHSVGYSEPGILNDIAAHGTAAHPLLPPVLALLARPRSEGEVVFVKPSNHANGLIPPLMAARPDARAIMLSSGCEAFLASIHRKGLPGRSWARRLYLEIQDYAPLNLGMDGRQVFAMSDLQVAGLAWLMNRRWFAMQMAAAGERLRSLDARLVKERAADTVRHTMAFAGAAISDEMAREIANGGTFARDAKTGGAVPTPSESHGETVDEEIAKVVQWIGQVSASAGIPLEQPAPLF
ncbi:hypothetical protein [Croceicoccus sediminis]|uniref:hypothetical protein n=1 Tax=Croceicoccus sediminis TaxID=2571150 RepID=UPI0011828D1C|nr:hypothetical protein [Croceicoccus sediminis]